MTCAKQRVTCIITAADGRVTIGENYCRNPQATCPRAPGEGYEKCSSICDQVGHAEAVAVDLAGTSANGATAELYGHSYACMDCQHRLFAAGVKWLGVRG